MSSAAAHWQAFDAAALMIAERARRTPPDAPDPDKERLTRAAENLGMADRKASVTAYRNWAALACGGWNTMLRIAYERGQNKAEAGSRA